VFNREKQHLFNKKKKVGTRGENYVVAMWEKFLTHSTW